MITSSAIRADAQAVDEGYDRVLRPESLGDYVGQSVIKESLALAIAAALQRGEPVDHILLYGPPGLGKTSLAHVIAKEMNSQIRITAGPALQKAGDVAAILTSLQKGDILFIDEIHRLPRAVEEVLYPAMEECHIDVLLGKGPGARSVRLEIAPFTLVGATTKAGSLSQPLRDRFGLVHRLEFYEHQELAQIMRVNSQKLSIPLGEEAILFLAARARSTPRIANRLLRRVHDYYTVNSSTAVHLESITEAIAALRIDAYGLDATDRLLLRTVQEQFAGGPVGLATLAAMIGEDSDTLESVIEPYLLRLGFLDRTPRGRLLTDPGRTYLHTSPT